MEQFSADLTLALEETANGRGRRWGIRRRTRSTGNLPLAPLPTEDSSSSQADHAANNNESNHEMEMHRGMCSGGNLPQSDSDDFMRSFSLKLRNTPMSGNFESDSLNENFSPTRPNTRRKRKFKRMAVEYETTTPSTPAHSTTNPLFPLTNVKKRVLKHNCQENFRASILFCGKRKRSHRERYMEYQSSSVPRQSLFTPKASYLEYKNRNRALKPCERILPLNKSILSKIEKISQDTRNKLVTTKFASFDHHHHHAPRSSTHETHRTPLTHPSTSENDDTSVSQKCPVPIPSLKSNSFDSPTIEHQHQHQLNQQQQQQHQLGAMKKITPTKVAARKARHRKRRQMKMQLQFNDENSYMDCGLNDFLSSSSLSSSDSEPIFANESEHEGDDELTDWPGNEAMINFASKNDFKRAKARPKLPQIPQMQDDLIQDDDTLMSTEDVEASGLDKMPGYGPSTSSSTVQPASVASSTSIFPPRSVSMPIDIATPYQQKQIESEMSGDTSNNILSSPNTITEVREIIAGCRRVREERPSYSIITPANEQLARFLQDETQSSLRLCHVAEMDKLCDLAKLYSLSVQQENGYTILSKTSKTMQSIRVDQSSFTKMYLSDYKRHCYGDDDQTNNKMTN